jgi:hypothetical protein
VLQSAIIAVAAVLGATAPVASANGDRIGDTYEITRVQESAQQSGGASSGTSYDRDTIIERVLDVRPDGLELEYDFPKEARPDEKAGNWQFPARVLRSDDGTFKLLNASELEARVTNWLKDADWPRTVCGRWVFTWNAFRIDCDPQSVLETIRAFDMRLSGLRDGADYSETGATGVGTLRRVAAGPNGATFTVSLPVDADAVRRARAESDVAVGEMFQKPVTLEAALRERAEQRVSGNVSIELKTNAAGNIVRKTKVTKLETEKTDGTVETETTTLTLDRRQLGPSDSQPGPRH